MSDTEHDTSVLGKRTRNGDNAPEDDEMKTEDTAATIPVDEDDDDDVGPMPAPAESNGNGVAKKKRKGEFQMRPCCEVRELNRRCSLHSAAA